MLEVGGSSVICPLHCLPRYQNFLGPYCVSFRTVTAHSAHQSSGRTWAAHQLLSLVTRALPTHVSNVCGVASSHGAPGLRGAGSSQSRRERQVFWLHEPAVYSVPKAVLLEPWHSANNVRSRVTSSLHVLGAWTQLNICFIYFKQLGFIYFILS